MIKVSAPGKLSIAGEWGILRVGNSGIVSTIDKRAYVTIKKSKDPKIHIGIKDFKIYNIEAEFQQGRIRFTKKLTQKERKKLSFIKSSIEVVLQYLKEWRPFKIETDTKEMYLKRNNKNRELGLGSSAAIVVATIAGILKFHNINIKRKEIRHKIYKLSATAHYLSQGKVGSGFDIAASTFGNMFLYRRFDPRWLTGQIQKNRNIKDIIDSKWPGFYYKKLKIPRNFNLIVGWTGTSASTSAMIRTLYKWRNENKREYKKLFDQIAVLVKKLTKAWKAEDRETIIKLLRENEVLLRILGEKSKLNIETKLFKKMSEIANKCGGAGKLSGAGGGDCGIALSFNRKISEKIKKEWCKNKIFIINTTVSPDGVRYEC